MGRTLHIRVLNDVACYSDDRKASGDALRTAKEAQKDAFAAGFVGRTDVLESAARKPFADPRPAA